MFNADARPKERDRGREAVCVAVEYYLSELVSSPIASLHSLSLSLSNFPAVLVAEDAPFFPSENSEPGYDLSSSSLVLFLSVLVVVS